MSDDSCGICTGEDTKYGWSGDFDQLGSRRNPLMNKQQPTAPEGKKMGISASSNLLTNICAEQIIICVSLVLFNEW